MTFTSIPSFSGTVCQSYKREVERDGNSSRYFPPKSQEISNGNISDFGGGTISMISVLPNVSIYSSNLS